MAKILRGGTNNLGVLLSSFGLFFPGFFLDCIVSSHSNCTGGQGSTDVSMAGVTARSSHECFPFYFLFAFLDCTIFRGLGPSSSSSFFLLYFSAFVWRGFQWVQDLIPFCTGVLFFHEGRGFGRLSSSFGGILAVEAGNWPKMQ